MMSTRTLKLLALSATLGTVAIAAAAGALMPKSMVAWAIALATCLIWTAGIAVGRIFGSASGWSLWAVGIALGAALATTGLIPRGGLLFVSAAIMVSLAAVLSAKAVGDAIDSRRGQH